MKRRIAFLFSFGALILLSFSAISQPKIAKQAIIHSTLTFSSSEEEDIQDQGRQGGRMGFGNMMMDGEFKIINYTKNDLSKIVVEADFINTSVYNDMAQKRTTTIMEIMGQKMGFYTDEEEALKMQHLRDSLVKSFNKNRNMDVTDFDVSVSTTNESKNIAGYACKKAFVITRKPESIDTAVVWVTSEIKLQNDFSSSVKGSIGMIPGISGAFKKIEKIDGFVMKYEIALRRGMRMDMEITKIDLKSNIADNEFQLPKNIDIKPISEMRNMFGGLLRGGM
jgi:hypothetical protein